MNSFTSSLFSFVFISLKSEIKINTNLTGKISCVYIFHSFLLLFCICQWQPSLFRTSTFNNKKYKQSINLKSTLSCKSKWNGKTCLKYERWIGSHLQQHNENNLIFVYIVYNFVKFQFQSSSTEDFSLVVKQKKARLSLFFLWV